MLICLTNSSYIPPSTILPSQKTQIMSASLMVESRWATAIVMRSSTGGSVHQGSPHDSLRLGTKGRSRFIEQDDTRLTDERTRDGDPLSLSSRKLATSLATMRLRPSGGELTKSQTLAAQQAAFSASSLTRACSSGPTSSAAAMFSQKLLGKRVASC